MGVVATFPMSVLWDEEAAEEEVNGPCPKIFAQIA